jgi:hypothetical protein
MKECNQNDYIINCDAKNVTLINSFCLEKTKPNIADFCKNECDVGYIREEGQCKACKPNL